MEEQNMKVELSLIVVGSDDVLIRLTRFLDLPFAPWVGMQFMELANESCDLFHHDVEDLWWNPNTESFFVRLTNDDCNGDGLTSQEIVDRDYSSPWTLAIES
jgi:hypothetical protein